ncbi:hypothetical protein MTX26_23390 [Bradyrhizobium sp. ISRA443]|uniref:hypothetical protein n=1 Tax=unclassified Bradyrhizobium TaxID=2631580 RepID=UPI00247AFCD1|nr:MULTISPECIES: hypothetical protein [unclassified Bradyrhizobium]WGR97363.1 hypothetical protein MTX23_23390 [Bradyrhizobium sp. ISRA436]WGS11135.1 hypothetical protein MTX26_23390 [Bradyrhizobium sp. ISRA443]
MATVTAMPAPCGVGTLCDERAFGFASATRSSIGRVAWISMAEIDAARTAAMKDRRISKLVIAVDDYSDAGTLIG